MNSFCMKYTNRRFRASHNVSKWHDKTDGKIIWGSAAISVLPYSLALRRSILLPRSQLCVTSSQIWTPRELGLRGSASISGFPYSLVLRLERTTLLSWSQHIGWYPESLQICAKLNSPTFCLAPYSRNSWDETTADSRDDTTIQTQAKSQLGLLFHFIVVLSVADLISSGVIWSSLTQAFFQRRCRLIKICLTEFPSHLTIKIQSRWSVLDLIWVCLIWIWFVWSEALESCLRQKTKNIMHLSVRGCCCFELALHMCLYILSLSYTSLLKTSM